MSFEITWLYSNRILEVAYWGVLDGFSLLESQKQIKPLIDASPTKVHTLANMSDVTLFELRLGDLKALRPWESEKNGWIVIYGFNDQLQLLNYAVNLIPEVKLVPSQHAACTFLKSVDPSLNDLNAHIT